MTELEIAIQALEEIAGMSDPEWAAQTASEALAEMKRARLLEPREVKRATT